MTTDLPFIEPARALRLQAGDLLVFQCAGRISAEMHDRIRATIKTVLPEGVKALVLDSSITLADIHTKASLHGGIEEAISAGIGSGA